VHALMRDAFCGGCGVFMLCQRVLSCACHPLADGALGMSEAPNRLTISHDSFVHAARFSDRVRYVTVAQVQPRRAANAPDPAGVETLAESALYMWPHLKNRVFRGDGSF